MTRGKKLKKDTTYSDNNPRSEIDNRETSASRRCKSLFSCCSKKVVRTTETFSDVACNEYDYIVEKLMIKRVPISLFATPYDVYKSKDKKSDPDGLLPVSESQTVYPIVEAVNSSLFYTSTNSDGPPGFPNRPSNKTLRFTRNQDVFDDDGLNATTSGYKDNIKGRLRDTELLNRFTALHPNLKESERAPKDPCPLNTTWSRRSLAEEISEIAAIKESPNMHYERTRNELSTTGSVYTAQPGTSDELSTLPAVEEIPTRDKAGEISSRYRTGSSFCFPFSWRTESRDEETEADASISQTEQESLTDVQDSSGASKNKNYIVAPVQVHYASPNLVNIRKIMHDERNCIDSASRNKYKLNSVISGKGNENQRGLEESSTDEHSEASEEPRIDNLAGTALRWKIIIKHHPPDSPATSGTAKGSSQPILSKGLRDVIEARIRRDSMSSKNDLGSSNKRKDEVPERTL